MDKFICIHGHFYQPPRENPWLESIELQDSAFPYHDWNERITAECYAPNATARMLDEESRIASIVNNYGKISFNFGPTLLAWMKENSPDIHQAIREADQQSRERFSGHGSALAQVYNHIILPLANPRDKHTQVLWGIRDFEFRFGRTPAGMWLSETAADTPTLDTLAQLGIRFTILSPHQASRVRKIGGGKWRDVNGGKVDPTRPYQVSLPSGRKIVVFFYDGPISQAVAFEKLLDDGGRFADRLMSAFDEKRGEDQLVHIATDGESYGHHHHQGEMGLAFALKLIEDNPHFRLTNYGEYLERHPPAYEVQIHEKSAWSCSHGVGRWYRHCGCNSGGHPGWNQHWREPLRQALDWLRDQLAPVYEAEARHYLHDPWRARDDYISVILDRSTENIDRFLERQGARELSPEDKINTIRLLELQRHALLMYTSCGWFFDELSGLETVQVIQYAGRVLQLATHHFDRDFETGFLQRLEQAKSNIPEHGDGRHIYEKFVKPAMVDREKVGAHYAVSSLFESYSKQARIYAFTVEEEERQLLTAGKARLAVGWSRVTFEITRGGDQIAYGVLHMGDHNINCGVRLYQGPEAFQAMANEVTAAFQSADFPKVIRLMDQHFGESSYSLRSLFRDEQRKVLKEIFAATNQDLEGHYRSITDQFTPLMNFLTDIGAPLYKALQTASEFVLNADLRAQFESDQPNLDVVRALLKEAGRRKLHVDTASHAYSFEGTIDRNMQRLVESPDNQELLDHLIDMTALLNELPFELNLWKTQNAYYRMKLAEAAPVQALARKGDSTAQSWINHFTRLGEQLGFQTKS
jgi:alpha-amylase/alpha-mannosidase (GH57 family)